MFVMNVRLSDIRVLPFFQACPPRDRKLSIKKDYFRRHGRYDRRLVLDSQYYLLDGYATYLAMLGNGEAYAEAEIVPEYWPVVHGVDRQGHMDFYGVPKHIARRCGPGDRLILFANGRFRDVRAESLGVLSGEAAWPARRFCVRIGHAHTYKKEGTAPRGAG